MKQNKLALLGLGIVVIMTSIAIFGPLVTSYTYDDQDFAMANAYPSPLHWFGTDSLGRDLLVRVLYGARISLSIGLAASLINLFIGVIYGGIAGLVGGRVDRIMATRSKGDYQIARASWIADYIDPMSFMEVFSDEENDAQYHNKTYNELIRQAKETNDPEVRMTDLHRAEQILFDDCVIIPIYYTTQPYAAQPYVKGYHWLQLGLVDFKKAYIE